MKNSGKRAKRVRFSAHAVFPRLAGLLFVLTMLSVCMNAGVYARYVSKPTERARVASVGGTMKVWEHKAVNDPLLYYQLDPTIITTKNTYDKVVPGADIPKDPFVQVKLENLEVRYELYIKVIESDYFPATYEISTDCWTPVPSEKGVYRYNEVFQLGRSYDIEIYILKDNQIHVTQNYVGEKDRVFTLTFEAWLMQTVD